MESMTENDPAMTPYREPPAKLPVINASGDEDDDIDSADPPLKQQAAPVDPAPAQPRKPQQPAAKKPPRPATARNIDAHVDSIEGETRVKDAIEIREWLDTFVQDGEVKVNIMRKQPSVGPNGERIGGSLETVDDKIDEDYVRQMWGGGKFSITVQTPRGTGQWKIAKRFQLEIAGPPKMFGQVVSVGGQASATQAVAADAEDSLAKLAFQTMATREEQTQKRFNSLLDQAGRQPGLDTHALQSLMQPVMQQLENAQLTIREMQAQAIAAANKEPPRDPFRDELMKDVISGDRSEAAKLRQQYEDRIQKLTDRYEARIDRLLEDHEKAISRLEDRHRDDLKDKEKQHDRNIDMMSKQTSLGDGVTKAAYELKVTAQEETIKRLERELGDKGVKIAALESKKDQTLFDKAEEIGKLRDVLADFGGGEEKDEKWYEKLFGVLGNSEAAVALIERISGGSPERQQQIVQQQQLAAQQAQLPPANVPFRGEDGKVYVHDGAGNFHEVVQAPRKKKKRPQAPAQAGAEGGEAANANAPAGGEEIPDVEDDEPVVPSRPPPKPPDPKDLERAIAFIENAIRSKDANPETFARGAQNLVPADVLQYVMSFDEADHLLAQVKLSPGSPLTSLKGRQFIRAVHKYLREGSV